MDKQDIGIAMSDIQELVINDWGIVNSTAFSPELVKAMQDEIHFEINDMVARFKRTFE